MADKITMRIGRRNVGQNIFEIGPGDADGRFVIGNDVNSVDRLDFGYSDAQSVFFDQTSGNDANAGTRVSPYETPWRAFQDIDNSTKFVAVQLDTTDIDIGTVPYRLQSDPNLGSASTLNASLDGVYESTLPNSCINVFEGPDNKLIFSGAGNILVSNNAGLGFQSSANTSGQTLAYGDYLTNVTGAAEDWIILAPSGQNNIDAVFMISDDGGETFTSYDTTALGLDAISFDEILFLSCSSNDTTATPATIYIGVLSGINYEVIRNSTDTPIGGWTKESLLNPVAWLNYTRSPYMNDSDDVKIAQLSNSIVFEIGSSTSSNITGDLPGGWGGSPEGVARSSTGFLVGSSGAWAFNGTPDLSDPWSAVTAPPITPLGLAASDDSFYVWDASSIYVTNDNASTWDQVTNITGFSSAGNAGFSIRSANLLTILEGTSLFILNNSDNIQNYGGVSGYNFGADFINVGPVYGCTNDASFQYVDGEINQSAILAFSQLAKSDMAQVYQSEFTNNMTIEGSSVSNIMIQRNQLQEYTIESNQAVITDNLALNSGNITKLVDDTNTISIQNNTIIGTLDLNNDAISNPDDGTGFLYADNLNENSITGSNPSNLISITSGNIRGIVTNINTLNSVSENPFFANTLDYQLQYVVNGFNFDSPFINSSVLSVTVTSGQPRAFGCWSFDTSAVTKGFSRSIKLPYPNREDSNSINWVWNNISNLQIPEGGKPDVFNNITKQTEKLMINYASIERKYVDQINNFISSFEDMTVELILNTDLQQTFPNSVTANGNQSAGTPTVEVNTTGTILPGYYLEFGGNTYMVLYPNPLGGVTTSVVLDRITQTDLNDLDSITVKAPLESSEWQFVPDTTISLNAKIPELVRNNINSQFTNNNSLWMNLKLTFIRERNG